MEKRRNRAYCHRARVHTRSLKLKPFEGDASLRDAYKDYWSVLLSVFTEEYHKIVDMEEVAEQSYDAMETYLLVQEKAGEKMDEAHGKAHTGLPAVCRQPQSNVIGRRADQAFAQAGADRQSQQIHQPGIPHLFQKLGSRGYDDEGAERQRYQCR